VTKEEFGKARLKMAKTQREIAQLLGSSTKAVESFEQGWRRVPPHVERQMLFLLAHLNSLTEQPLPCWEVQHCPTVTRRRCPAWEFQVGRLCWFINGTICHGTPQDTWEKKMKLCRSCNVFQNMFPDL